MPHSPANPRAAVDKKDAAAAAGSPTGPKRKAAASKPAAAPAATATASPTKRGRAGSAAATSEDDEDEGVVDVNGFARSCSIFEEFHCKLAKVVPAKNTDKCESTDRRHELNVAFALPPCVKSSLCPHPTPPCVANCRVPPGALTGQ